MKLFCPQCNKPISLKDYFSLMQPPISLLRCGKCQYGIKFPSHAYFISLLVSLIGFIGIVMGITSYITYLPPGIGRGIFVASGFLIGIFIDFYLFSQILTWWILKKK